MLAIFSDKATAQEGVSFATLEAPVRLIGFWFPGSTEAPAPAVVLLHGCEGPYGRSGRLSERMRDFARLLNDRSLYALVLDSFTPSGEREIFTRRFGPRGVRQANRRLDALAAVAWLARQVGAESRRIGLLGWSNGGSTVLAEINASHPAVAASKQAPAFALRSIRAARRS